MAVCASCGAENAPGFRFCGSCGAALEAPRGETRETRKTVTVVFCDVTGSTALGERLDPESLRSVMARYFEAMRGVIEHHGGTVEKFIGDAVMAVFGVPVLHEDDAPRAVRAAADMRKALAELNQELERDFGTTLLVRIGVNTGQVVTGTAERLAIGDAVNVAARLEQAAEPGEILVGPETHAPRPRRCGRGAGATARAEGKSAGLQAYRLLAVHADVPGHARRFDAPLVGRERERRLLDDTWERAVSERSCFFFTLLGMAGVGKSRLATEFLSGLDASVVRGRCLSYGEGITYWPVVEAVLPLLGPDREARVAQLGLDDEATSILKALLGEIDASFSPEAAAWAVRKLFEAEAARRPLVVVFDDVHWGEPTFFDLVDHVALLSCDAPILLLCIGRPELLEERPAWGGGMLNATTVLLEALSPEESEQLVEELLGEATLEGGWANASCGRRAGTRSSSRRCWRWCAKAATEISTCRPPSRPCSPRAWIGSPQRTAESWSAVRSRARCSIAERSSRLPPTLERRTLVWTHSFARSSSARTGPPFQAIRRSAFATC